LRATVHSVTDRQMDGQMDDMMTPIVDHTVQQYDRLKMTRKLAAYFSKIQHVTYLRIEDLT